MDPPSAYVFPPTIKQAKCCLRRAFRKVRASVYGDNSLEKKVSGEGRKIEGEAIRSGRKRPLKCELSVTKEAGAAPLPVIGLAPVPKKPPPSPVLSRFSFFAPPLPLLPAEAAFLGFGGARRRRRRNAGGCSRLRLPPVWIDWG